MASAGGERPEQWEEQLLAELRALAEVADPLPPRTEMTLRGTESGVPIEALPGNVRKTRLPRWANWNGAPSGRSKTTRPKPG